MTSTPFLQVDRELTLANIARMANWAAQHKVLLRPHVKTHKTVELAMAQRAAGAAGITVATVGEAEVFARAGFTDIFIAYSLWVNEALAERLNAVATRARLIIGADSVASLHQALPLLSPGIEWRLEVDSGHHRSGAHPHEVIGIAEALLRAHRTIDGVFSYPGHSYSLSTRADAADDEARALREASDTLRQLGISKHSVSGGSSPSMEFARTDIVGEFRPGVYVFGDAQQWELGSHSPAEISLWAVATVINARPGRFVTNAGSKLIGADRAPYATGYGRLLDDPGARIVLLSEHHSVVESAITPPIGATVRIVPNHVCNAVNLVDALSVTTGETILVNARGHND